ncbi:unnamed protein product [Calypogeia fissa]
MQARQLNESLYELYKPCGRPSMTVLFFHGFQLGDNYSDAHLSTWSSGDGSCIWPQSWLVEKFQDAYILSVSYNARVMKSWEGDNIDLFIIGENLTSDLLQANIGQEPRCPVILVGHSFGGMVIKQLCVHASREKNDSRSGSDLNTFLENIKGIFFYATPHQGSPFFTLAANFIKESPLLEFVKTLSMPTARLNFHFDKLCRHYKTWQIAGLGESLPLKWGTFHDVVVPEASARLCSSFNVVEGADHISISRPSKKISRSFNTLVNFLINIASNSKNEEIPENFQHLPKPIVDIDGVLKNVKGKLGTTTSLGFAGMGGIGKTTLAMALFNDLESQYEYTCFVEVKNVKVSIKMAILEDLHHWGKKIPKGECKLSYLRGKQLLLILDDVSSEEDLEMIPTLLDDIAVLKNSHFVATSRDFELLDLHLDEVHSVSLLSHEGSRHLFLSYAFPKGVPSSFVGYTNDVVQTCEGLPLTLEVVGKYLYKKGELVWKQALQALDKAEAVARFDEKLWAKLKLSYDGLDTVEQEMFLDAATVFYGFDLYSALAAWSITTGGFQDMRWKKLVDLSLVWELHEDEGDLEKAIVIGMHEQLLSLARKIASTPKENGHWIWDDSQKACNLLSAKNCTLGDAKGVVALRVYGHTLLDYDELLDCNEEAEFQGIDSNEGDLEVINFNEGDTEENHSMEEELDGESCSEGDFEDESLTKGLASSRSKAVTRLFGSTLCKMAKLRYLSIEFMPMGQSYYVKLPTLPPSLVCLRFFGENFTTLPLNPSSYKKMVILSLKCKNLSTLPDTFGHLLSLQMLYIESHLLESLPESFGNLARLTYLKIKDCHTLQRLPDTIGNLRALECLNITGCKSLAALPNSIGCLTRLRRLIICECRLLCELPETFLQLQELQQIALLYTSLLDIPNLGDLRSLRTVVMKRYPWARFPRWLGIVIEGERYQNTLELAFSVLDGQFALHTEM